MIDRRFILTVAAWLAMCIVLASAPPLWLFIPAGVVWLLLGVVLWFGSREVE